MSVLEILYHNTLKFASQLSSVKQSVARMAWKNNLNRKKVRDFKNIIVQKINGCKDTHPCCR